MAESLHYLDKMEYRPTPKQRSNILLKRRPVLGETTTAMLDSAVDVIDKRKNSGFKREIVKEYERIIGFVQEKKQKLTGEPKCIVKRAKISSFNASKPSLETKKIL